MQTQQDIASNYILDNFQPDDRIAVVLINRERGDVRQRLLLAERAAGPMYQSWLRAANSNGADVYVSMNTLKPDARGRTKADIDQIRHVFLDIDEGGRSAVARALQSPGLPRPNYVLNTSPDKFQIIWKVDGYERDTAEDLMRAMARSFGSDPAVTDSSRVLRLPEFRNHKYEQRHFVKVEHLVTQTYRPEHFPPFAIERETDRRARDRSVVTPERILASGSRSQSERDWAYALRALGRGDDREQVKQRIAAFRTDKPDPSYYADRTVTRASQVVRQITK